jgi:hypothetical protein
MLGECGADTETIETFAFTRIRTIQGPRLYDGRWVHVYR